MKAAAKHALLTAIFSILPVVFLPFAALGAGTTERSIKVNGVERSFELTVPPQVVSGGKPAPLVIVLHGNLGTPEQVRGYMSWDKVAKREGFIVAYPAGIDRTWNDGRPVHLRRNAKPGDDVAFLTTLTDHLESTGLADKSRVYVTGLSNGGFMSVRLACEASDRFAAYAPVIASAPLDTPQTCVPPRPLPMLIMNGTKDPLLHWDGTTRNGEPVMAVNDHVAFWVRHNGCQHKEETALPDIAPNDRSTVRVQAWSNCKANAAVTLYAIEGGGHQAPSSVRTSGAFAGAFLGPQNHDIDTAEITWSFLKRFSR